MTLQYITTGITLACCLIYAGWRIHKAMKIKSGNHCTGCPIKGKTCARHDQSLFSQQQNSPVISKGQA